MARADDIRPYMMPSLKPPLKINPPRLDLQPQGGTSKRGDRSPPFAWSVSRRGVFQGEREIEIPLPLNGVLPPLPTRAKEVAPQSEIFRADDILPLPYVVFPPELYEKIHILEIMGRVCPKLPLPAPKNAQKNRPVTKDGPVCVLCLIFSDLRPRRRTCPSSPCSRPCCRRWPGYRP